MTSDLNIRVYEHSGKSITRTPSANGLATIWHKDVLLFAISTLIEAPAEIVRVLDGRRDFGTICG